MLQLARALHDSGASSMEVERRAAASGRALGLAVATFATPTAIFVDVARAPVADARPAHVGSLLGAADRTTHLMRVQPGAIDLGRLEALAELEADVVAGRTLGTAGVARIAAILRREPLWSAPVQVLAYAVTALGAARLLGGGVAELLAAALVGALVGLAALAQARLPSASTGWFDPAASALAAGSAAALTATPAAWGALGGGPPSPQIVTIAALIVLLPGLGLTRAMDELAARNLASGTARLLGAVTTVVAMGFGIAVGRALATAAGAEPIAAPSAIPPPWLPAEAAVVLSAPALIVLFGGRARDVVPAAIAGLAATWGAAWGAASLGPQLGVSLGAAAVALVALTFERVTARPAAIAAFPGLLLLVPGTMGLRSFEMLLAQDVTAGIAAAFHTVLTAMAIVAGLMLVDAVAASLPAPAAARR